MARNQWLPALFDHSDFGLLRHFQCILNLDTQVANGALKFCVTSLLSGEGIEISARSQ
jgi:hypothetical protein